MKNLRLNISYFLRNTKLIYKADPKNLLIVTFLKILETPIPVFKIYLAKLIMDEIALAISSVNHDYSKALAYLAMEFGLVALSSILGLISQFASNKLSMNLELFFSKTFFDKVSKIEYKHLEDPGSADLISDASTSSFKSFNLFQEGVDLVSYAVQLFSFIGLLVSINIYIAISIICISTISFFVEIYFVKKKEDLRKGSRLQSRRRWYFSDLITKSSSAKELMIIDGHKKVSDKYFDSFIEIYLANLKITENESVFNFVFKLVSNILYYSFYAWIVIQTIFKHITLGSLTLYLSTFSRVESSITLIYYKFKEFFRMAIVAKNYFDFLDLTEDSSIGVSETVFSQIIKNPKVEFENVSFKYPGSKKFIIENLSFSIDYGQKIALVGENGAGKTTIIKLLNRLYKPTSGVIKIGGTDISLLSRRQVGSLFSVVFQDFTNFKFLFKESIDIANDKASDVLYKKALEDSGADKILDILPLRDNHPLTRMFSEDGIDLSGGQWQKIALARAFIRGSQILILDEPTAAIDANQEFEIFSKFQELTKGKTSLLVSHRFSTVRMADQIIFLENGKIVEQGSHQELISLNGKYALMFNRQAQGYL